ncbi:MAG: DPP IV N-terminal domain-containing protein [Flavobacteriales bacterium]|nr:DPP IV N-terminal domain-containing protein [Flavobacteriales bacterium]
MNRSNCLACAFTLLLVIPNYAQQQSTLTLADAVTKAYSTYAPSRMRGLQWLPDAAQYAHQNDSVLFINGAGKSMDRPVLTLGKLNKGLGKDAGLDRLPDILWENSRTILFWHADKLFECELNSGNSRVRLGMLDGSENKDLDPTRTRVAYTLDDDLYIGLAGNGQQVRVTQDGGQGIVNGKSVHREEYGIQKGTFWSPNGERLAFYRMDESMVTTYDLEDISTKPSTFEAIRYPMAGQTSHEVSIGVHDLNTGRTIFLQTTGARDDYLTNIAWGPNSDKLYVVHLDRATENLRLVEYDVRSGRAQREVLKEHSDVYLEPEHPVTFLNGSSDRFLWWSDRDGHDHVYLFDLDEGLVKQLTQGEWNVKRVIGQDPKGRTLFLEGSGEILRGDPSGALQTHLYTVDLKSGNLARLTTAQGSHSGELSPDGSMLLDQWSSISVPHRTELLDAGGSVMKVLLDSEDPLRAVLTGSMEFLTIPGEEGDLLNARLIKPSHFDPAQKYPVLIYVYNGPHVQLVRDQYLGGASLWMMHAAERGYLVFTVDGHGSSGRSRDFEQTIHRRLGEVEIKDQLHGVAYLRELPYVDGERMAVHGWSYGGYMTTSLMLKAPGTFRIGVAGGPVMDWSMYEVMYTERYMDTPEENPDGYSSTRLPDKCAALQGELLVIHGLQDNVVLPEHSYSFLKSCVDQGVQVGFFVYPGHAHNVRGKDRVHLMTKVLSAIDNAIQP